MEKQNIPVQHTEILGQLLEMYKPMDYEELILKDLKAIEPKTNPTNSTDTSDSDIQENDKEINQKIKNNHYLVIIVDHILEEAQKKWGLCKKNNLIYLYNGCFWEEVPKEEFEHFLGSAAERLGVPVFTAKFYQFREQLYKQFMSRAYLPNPKEDNNKVMVNLLNETLEFTQEGIKTRNFNSSDFLLYQLPYRYDPEAKCPLFKNYLNQVLPDEQSQKVLLEYIAFLFFKHGSKVMKEEKALILYGTGANGKSVFFEIVNALLGEKNISNFSLQSLTNENGYYRAKLSDKLVNYASEINGKLEASIFKQLVSGEPVEARLPYGQPFILKKYAKLIFNCNELPKDVEQTNGYFRRFLIIPFNITIPAEQQDKDLHTKIISAEMPGVLNLVIQALHRLISQKKFSECDAARLAVEQYRTQSDSVKMFLTDNEISTSVTNEIALKELFYDYRCYCDESGLKQCSLKTFTERLRNMGFETSRKSFGTVVNALKKVL
ncbi:DNA primase family protein [Chryseobacterium luquanense]|uniref:Phage/plasmid primase, P4 family n=1 Tax=Chryseobacterium luquanense TaxID=2983766 RepID=A0ABT3Y8E9_9FLAO|nr:DNA primase family protein [Chryseobacterium luquanense]MCX8534331.1 phage/plasmid primase, P4 family [Chryseobacterium luquanense]